MEPILLRPLINEKSMLLAKNHLYTFEVSKKASKQSVAKAVASKFNVDVLGVSIINSKPKKKMQRSRKGFFTVAGRKKAIVSIKKDQKIPIFETSSKEEETKVTTVEGEVVSTNAKDFEVIKEKKSLFGGTKVTIGPASAVKIEKSRGQDDLKQSHKEKKKGKI